MTLFNVQEMQAFHRRRAEKKNSHMAACLTPSKHASAEKCEGDTTHTSMISINSTSVYSRAKKTLSSLEMKYANANGLVPSQRDILDDSESIANCRHRGDSPAGSMDEEETSIKQESKLKVSKDTLTLSDLESHRSDKTKRHNDSQSRSTTAATISQDENQDKFMQVMLSYINKTKVVTKSNCVDFKRQHKDYIFSKLVQMTSDLKRTSEVENPLASRYSFPSLQTYRLKCNSLENTLVYCYLNSVLQFLFCIRELVYYFNTASESSTGSQRTCKLFKKIIDQYQSHDLKELDATALLRCFSQKIQVNVQQDVDELLRLMFDQMQQELKPPPKKKSDLGSASSGLSSWHNYCLQEDSIFTYLFLGQTRRRTTCFACLHRSEYSEPFDILSLSLTASAQTIEDLFEANFSSELIEEGFACSGCNHRAPAVSRLLVSHLPRYLIVQLKRFTMFPHVSKSSQVISCSEDGILDVYK